MVDLEKERAEVFDALGHPTRISILKLLSHEPLSFADLKRKTDIDSSGHLQHHLTKLDGLIKTDEHGNYRLSDAGDDALYAIRAVRSESRKEKSRRISHDRRSRLLLSILVASLATCLIVSTLFLYGVETNLNRYASQTLYTAENQRANLTEDLTQYFAQIQQDAQNQYVVDTMTGDLSEDGHATIGPGIPMNLSTNEWFNYTVNVFSDLNPPSMGYILHNYATIDLPPPSHNDTYYEQGFLVYDLTVFGPSPSQLVNATTYPIKGPEGWNGQVIWPPWQDVPPYQTAQTFKSSTGLLSGGAPRDFTSLIPIDVFGNYTFALRNEGNSTIQVWFKVTTPVVIFETKPLTETNYPAWSSRFAEERVVRVRQIKEFNPPPPPTVPALQFLIDTTPTISTATTLAILSAALLAILSMLVINRKKT